MRAGERHRNRWENLRPVHFAAVMTALLGWAVADVNGAEGEFDHYARTNLVAWCIVPFDGAKRGPAERAAMLERLGIGRFAYDYRAEHVPTFDEEMEALKKHGIELTAWWFPGVLNDEARHILEVLREHRIKTQLWVTGGGGAVRSEEEQRARVESEAARLAPIAVAAKEAGCTLGLYNHGGWFGDPDNQIAIIQRLEEEGIDNVGIVYNQHHGHEHVDEFAAFLDRMKPYLLVLNLNGMARDGDKKGQKILPIGQGELDVTLLGIIRESGWTGPVGILNHTDADAEARLVANMNGLREIEKQLDGKAAGSLPSAGSGNGDSSDAR